MSDIYLKTECVISLAQKTFKDFMDYSIKRHFERIILPMACGKSCNVCTKDNFTPHKKKCRNHRCLCRNERGRRVCPNGICGRIYEHLVANNAAVQYLNKHDPNLLSKSPDIIAESFMPYYKKKRIGGTYDISAVATYFKNNIYAQDFFGHGVNVPLCCQKILECRREYAHSTITMGMTQEYLDKLIENLLILLPATMIDECNAEEAFACMQILKEVIQGKETFNCIVMVPKDCWPEVRRGKITFICIVMERKDDRPEILKCSREYAHSTIKMGVTKEYVDKLIENLLPPSIIDECNAKETFGCMQILKGVIQGKETFTCIVTEAKDDRPEVKKANKTFDCIVMEAKDDKPEVIEAKKTFNCIVNRVMETVMEPKDDRWEVTLQKNGHDTNMNSNVKRRTRMKEVRSLIELGNGQQNNDFDMKTGSSTGYEFRKTEDDTIKEAYVLQYANLMPSVGLIYSSVTSGTIFRAGTKKAVTAWHVVKKITDPHGTKNYDFNKLNHPDIYITFGQTSRQFRLKGINIFTDKDLDISVLEFTDDASLLPPPLPLLPDEVFGVNDVAIIGYGHPSDNNKMLTHSAKVLPKETVKNGLEATMNYIKANHSTLCSKIRLAGNDPNSVDRGYNGYDNPDGFLFKSFVGPGASGSPLFSKEDPSSLEVVGVFKCGYPEFAYHLPKEYPIDPEFTFEMATKMSSIYKSIESRDQTLLRDLFQLTSES